MSRPAGPGAALDAPRIGSPAASGAIVKGRGGGLVVNIIVGIVGSLLGGWIFSLFGLFAMGTAGSLITAIVGAIILLWIVSLLSTKKTSKV